MSATPSRTSRRLNTPAPSLDPTGLSNPVSGRIIASGNSGATPTSGVATLVPFTSPWWLDRLGRQLDARTQVIGRLRQYYAGEQPLAYATQKFRDAFGQTFSKWSDNFMRMVIQATEERITVAGFKWPTDPKAMMDDPNGGTEDDGTPTQVPDVDAISAGDRAAWDLWQANQMDAQSQKAHREALLCGDCSVIIQPGAGGSVIIRVQWPEQVVVAYGDDPLERVVAMKRWTDAGDRILATLYYPDHLEKYQKVTAADKATGIAVGQWVPRQGPDGTPLPWPTHDLGVVPVVPLVNDPDIDNKGTSEIASLLPLQDALNKLFVDLLISSEYAAFRQRWATGIEIPSDPETGKAVQSWKPSVERIWSTPVPDARFGDFDQTDVTGMIASIDEIIQHIATQTRTPAHYLLGNSGVFPSGESLRATETGLVAKAKRRMRDFGEAWEEIIGLAFKASGQSALAEVTDGETQWADPEYRTESEHIAALVQEQALGVPQSVLWLAAGYSPQQVEEWLAVKPEAAHPQATPKPPAAGAGPDTQAPEIGVMSASGGSMPDVISQPPSAPSPEG